MRSVFFLFPAIIFLRVYILKQSITSRISLPQSQQNQNEYFLRKKNTIHQFIHSLWNTKKSFTIGAEVDHQSIDEGISFSRKINLFTDFLSINVGLDEDRCSSKDEYGSNDCHYDWGDTMNMTFDVQLQKAFDVNDRISGNFKVMYFIPWNFECAICGQDCTLTIPGVDLDIKVPLPPCPLGNDNIPEKLQIYVGDSSPLDGVPLHVEGDVNLILESDMVVASDHVKTTMM